MQRILVALTLVSAVLYVVLAFAIRQRMQRKSNQSNSPKLPRPAYFWGFLFAVLFYYGFPIWWWRYGFRRALYLMIVCVGGGFLIQTLLRIFDVIEVENFSASIAVGILIAVPIRAIAGVWVAMGDSHWRKTIISIRS